MSDLGLTLLLAGAASCMFGVSQVCAKRGLAYMDAQTGALVTIGTATLLYGLAAPLWARADEWFTLGFWVFVINGLFHPMLSMYMALEATSRTGPTVAATFSATAPLFASLSAVVFLGESVTILVLAGTLATVLGIATLSWVPGSVRRVVVVALLFATGAAVVRGLNQTVGKYGLELTPNVFMAAFVSFVVSTLGLLLIYRLRSGGWPHRLPAGGRRWFVLNGVLIGSAIGCMYAALSVGTVVVVAPIIAAYPLFALMTSLALGEEHMSRRLLAGVVLVVAGVALVSRGG